jgi:TolB protein
MKILKSAFAVLLFTGFAVRADLDISVSQGVAAPRPVAIVPFAQAPGLSQDIAQIISDDLDRSGYFKTLPRADMLEKPTEESQVDYRNWRTVGREAIAIGKVQGTNGGPITVSARLLDVYQGQKILDIDGVTAAKPSEYRSAAHRVADLIYEKLTGRKGYFNTQIAYVTASGPVNNRRFQLLIADADGETPRVIATSREPLMSPAWSPDGRKIAYVGYERGYSAIYVQTPATGDLLKFVGEKGINGAPAWSPDGSKLVVTLSYETNPDLYVIDLATRTKHRITSDPAIDTEASWSPDGSQIAFLSDRGGSAQIYMVSANGGDARRITFQGKRNEMPRFSPDGKTLALVNFDGSSYRIALLNLATGAMRVVSDGPQDESPSFAPNGDVIIYTSQGSGGAELATVSFDGQIRQRLRQSGDVREPAWAPYPSKP